MLRLQVTAGSIVSHLQSSVVLPICPTSIKMLPYIPPAQPATASSSTTATPNAMITSQIHDNTFSIEDQNAVLSAEIERVEAEFEEFRAKHEACEAELQALERENERLKEQLDMVREEGGVGLVSDVCASGWDGDTDVLLRRRSLPLSNPCMTCT